MGFYNVDELIKTQNNDKVSELEVELIALRKRVAELEERMYEVEEE